MRKTTSVDVAMKCSDAESKQIFHCSQNVSPSPQPPSFVVVVVVVCLAFHTSTGTSHVKRMGEAVVRVGLIVSCEEDATSSVEWFERLIKGVFVVGSVMIPYNVNQAFIVASYASQPVNAQRN
jgi:hypothetical protein